MDRSVPGRERKGRGGPHRREEMSERAVAGSGVILRMMGELRIGRRGEIKSTDQTDSGPAAGE